MPVHFIVTICVLWCTWLVKGSCLYMYCSVLAPYSKHHTGHWTVFPFQKERGLLRWMWKPSTTPFHTPWVLELWGAFFPGALMPLLPIINLFWLLLFIILFIIIIYFPLWKLPLPPGTGGVYGDQMCPKLHQPVPGRSGSRIFFFLSGRTGRNLWDRYPCGDVTSMTSFSFGQERERICSVFLMAWSPIIITSASLWRVVNLV